MKTALFPAPSTKKAIQQAILQKQTPQQRVAEKLDLELDFAKASLPAKTRLTHPHILFSPMHYEPGYAYPLLIWLHGTGGDERQLMRIMPVVSMRNYVAVAPRGLPLTQPSRLPVFDLSVSAILQRPKQQYDWLLSDDNLMTVEQRVFDCIAVAQERCNIADHRIFIAGFGTGGTMALRLATLFPECFAGTAAFGGEIPTDTRIFPSWQRMQSPFGQPLSVFLGVDESAPDHVCQLMEFFYTAGLTAEICEYPDTKQLTTEMLQNLNRWMMQIVCQPQQKPEWSTV
jgi:phospholipase/carboxylesterase